MCILVGAIDSGDRFRWDLVVSLCSFSSETIGSVSEGIRHGIRLKRIRRKGGRIRPVFRGNGRIPIQSGVGCLGVRIGSDGRIGSPG